MNDQNQIEFQQRVRLETESDLNQAMRQCTNPRLEYAKLVMALRLMDQKRTDAQMEVATPVSNDARVPLTETVQHQFAG